jgi:hypothetical protein
MARQRKWPCCHPGRRNGPWAPNPPDEAIPSHPQPTMGGTSMPTMSDPMSARANDQDPCLQLIGRDCQPSSQDLQATTAHGSAAIMLDQMACRCKRPCCCPGRRIGPWAPHPPDEAIPSHPQPTLGGTSMPTMSGPTSAQANNQDPRLHLSPSL